MNNSLCTLLLLVRKNWLLQIREPVYTLIEIIGTMLVFFMVAILRAGMKPQMQETLISNSFSPLPFLNGGNDDGLNFKQYTLIYSPQNKALDEVMSPFRAMFAQVTPLNSSDDLLKYYTIHGMNATFGAIQFDDSLGSRNDLGSDKNIKVTIRFPSELRYGDRHWRTGYVFPILKSMGPRDPSMETGAIPSYYQEGFLALQYLVSLFISWKNGNLSIPANETDLSALVLMHNSPTIRMRRFPHARWYSDSFAPFIVYLLPFSILFTFICIGEDMIKVIIREKELQLKETMKSMGVTPWIYWSAWFVKGVSYFMVVVIIGMVFLNTTLISDIPTLRNANPVVIVIFLFAYACASTTFCFAVCSFFSKGTTATLVYALLWYATFIVRFIFSSVHTSSMIKILLMSLLSNSAMSYGCTIILLYEYAGEGINWNNMWKPFTVDGNVTMGLVIIMLFVDTILYLLIASYVEAVFPGEYGIPQKWYFPCTSAFWKGQPSSIDKFQCWFGINLHLARKSIFSI